MDLVAEHEPPDDPLSWYNLLGPSIVPDPVDASVGFECYLGFE